MLDIETSTNGQEQPFNVGDVVFLKVNATQIGIVTGLLIRHNGIQYLVTWAFSHEEQAHYQFELVESQFECVAGQEESE
jgi:hypothetical protein